MLFSEVLMASSVEDGEVMEDGRPVRLRVILQRRWGWPRAAANAAAEILRARAAPGRAVVHLVGAERMQQQQELLRSHPDLVTGLCEGLARGKVHTDEHEAGLRIRRVEVALSHTVHNLGLVSNILALLEQRFGSQLNDVVITPHGAGTNPAVAIAVSLTDDQ